MDLLSLAVGAVGGLLLCWLLMRSRTATLRERTRQLERQLDAHREREAEMETRIEALRTAKTELETREEELQNMQEQFETRFENLTNRLFEESTEKLTRHSKTRIEEVLKPVKKSIESFKEKVEKKHEADIEARTSLKEQLDTLRSMSERLGEEASDLTAALRTRPETRGAWGEISLERLLEETGLTRGREYDVQESVGTDEGGHVRPDVVVHLPDERYVVIDAKVSLVPYQRMSRAEEDEERDRARKQLLTAMRSHVRDLASKDYHRLHGNRSPDFVLMFVPLEGAFAAAIQADDELYEDAFSKNVVLVSPTTLLATLSTIANIWKQEYQSQNVEEIARRGGLLYDKFVNFVEALEEIGRRLEQASESHRTAMKRLTRGRGDLVGQAEKLRELGADASKELPSSVRPRSPSSGDSPAKARSDEDEERADGHAVRDSRPEEGSERPRPSDEDSS